MEAKSGMGLADRKKKRMAYTNSVVLTVGLNPPAAHVHLAFTYCAPFL